MFKQVAGAAAIAVISSKVNAVEIEAQRGWDLNRAMMMNPAIQHRQFNRDFRQMGWGNLGQNMGLGRGRDGHGQLRGQRRGPSRHQDIAELRQRRLENRLRRELMMDVPRTLERAGFEMDEINGKELMDTINDMVAESDLTPAKAVEDLDAEDLDAEDLDAEDLDDEDQDTDVQEAQDDASAESADDLLVGSTPIPLDDDEEESESGSNDDEESRDDEDEVDELEAAEDKLLNAAMVVEHDTLELDSQILSAMHNEKREQITETSIELGKMIIDTVEGNNELPTDIQIQTILELEQVKGELENQELAIMAKENEIADQIANIDGVLAAEDSPVAA